MFKNLLVASIVISSGAVLAQDASVGIGPSPQSTNGLKSEFRGKCVYLHRPRSYESRYSCSSTAMSGMQDLVARLGLDVTDDIREADYILHGYYTVTRARVERKGLDFSGIFGGFLSRRSGRTSIDSRDEHWEFTAKVDFSLSKNNGSSNRPGRSELRIVGSAIRSITHSVDQRVRLSAGRGSIGFGGSSDREPRDMAEETLSQAFDRCRATSNRGEVEF